VRIFELIDAGDEDGLSDLLDGRPDLAEARDPGGLSPVLHALLTGRDDLVDPLLAANPALDVFDAAAVGRTRGLQALLDGDPELAHARRPDGSTALHLAARFDQAAAVELLLERGADPGARDAEGHTPADVASEGTRALLAPGG
jgi:uncharacterized protein